MKKLFTFTFLLSLLAVTVFLSSYKSDTHLFNKCVFPIIDNIDKAWAKTDLNGHIKGDSIEGYEIWGRNHYGTDFQISTVSPYVYFNNDLYTGNNSLSVGGEMSVDAELIYAKKIFTATNLKFNTVEFTSYIANTGDTTIILFYVLNEDKEVLVADTIYEDIAPSDGFYFQSLTLSDTITLAQGAYYYTGVCFLDSLAGNVGNIKGDTYEEPAITDSTWVLFETGVSPPPVDTTLATLQLADGSLNLHFLLK